MSTSSQSESIMHIFTINEVVQALDDTTSIWEEAKIIGIISDWSVRVKWVNWTNTAPVNITVPTGYRYNQELWNIRKPFVNN